MAKKSTDRVRRFRGRMGENGYVRFEATIDRGHVSKLRELAYVRKMEIWQAVEKAIELLEADTGNTVSHS